MANKFTIECLSPTENNPVEFGCCSIYTCTVTNVHNTTLNVDSITFGFVMPLLFSATGISINGATPFGSNLPIALAPGASLTLEFRLCHTGLAIGDTTTFKIYIDTVEHAVETYDFDVISVAGCLCCLDIDVLTENNFIRSVDGFCNSNELYTESAVCEEKTIVYQFRYPNGINDGLKIWFNPWLFAFYCDFESKYISGQIDSPPTTAYFIEMNSLIMTVGSFYHMALIGAGSNVMAAKNWRVRFQQVDAFRFNIHFTFYLHEDIENWLQPNLVPNNTKWRRTDTFAVNQPIGDNAIFDNIVPSVYNLPKKLCGLVYLQDPNIVDVDENIFECFEKTSISWTSRWYNSGLYGGVSEFTNPTWTLERNAVVVTDFSSVQETTIKFVITIPGIYGTLAGVIFQLFDETQLNNTVDFLDNYDSSRSIITTTPGSGTLNNHLNLPTAIVPLGGGVFEISANVATSIPINGIHRIAAIIYSDQDIVNTFLSPAYTVKTTPDLNCDDCQIDLQTFFKQYFKMTETPCLRPTAKERVNHRLVINGGTLNDCIDSWNGSPTSFLNFLNSIQLTIYRRVDNFPAVGQSTLFVWGQHTSNRNTSIVGNWQNLNDLIVSDDGTTIETDIQMRIRWENTPFDGGTVLIANQNTYMNRTNAGALASVYTNTLGITNDWRGETIYLEYKFQFDFSSLFPAPYQLNQVVAYQIAPIQNESDNSGFAPILTNIAIEGFDIGTETWLPVTGQICPTNFSSMRIVVDATENGDFIFFMNPLGGGVNTLSENENNQSPYGLALQNNVISVDPDFAGGDAVAEFNPSALSNGSWELCGYISTPPNDFDCDYFDDVNCGVGSTTMICGSTTPEIATLEGSNAGNGAKRLIQFSDFVMGVPIPGQSYVIEWNLISGSATTKELHIWAGLNGGFAVAGSRPSDFVIPIGSTGGNGVFVWGGNDTTGKMSFQLKSDANPNWSGIYEIKIGQPYCP